MRKRILVIAGIGIVAAVAAATTYTLAKSRPPIVPQPIAFNHHLHTVKENDRSPVLACTECHTGAESSAVAGLPSIDRCLQCHMKQQSDRPEEQVVRIAAARGPLAFEQVTRNAGNVYFSHRAHTVLGKLQCAQCHGDVTSWTTPPEHPEPRLMNMDACMDCHRQRGASTACRACHL